MYLHTKNIVPSFCPVLAITGTSDDCSLTQQCLRSICVVVTVIGHMFEKVFAYWCRGMVLALSATGPGLNSLTHPPRFDHNHRQVEAIIDTECEIILWPCTHQLISRGSRKVLLVERYMSVMVCLVYLLHSLFSNQTQWCGHIDHIATWHTWHQE